MSEYDETNIHGELFGPGSESTHRGSRGEFLKIIKQVPVRIQSELQQGKLRLGDQVIYSIKQVGTSTTIKMLETQDDKETGLRNISNAKLPKNQMLMVSGIYLLAGVPTITGGGSTPTKDEIMATRFSSIDRSQFAAIANGEFNLKANKVQLVPETSMRIFCVDNTDQWPIGFYKLHNPRLIQDDVLIEATLELGTVQNIPANTHIFMGLYGTITTP